jgi:hypothetical protein
MKPMMIIALAQIVCATQSLAQAIPTRSLMTLIEEGYEVKAMTIPGPAILLLQKGNSAWFCVTRGSQGRAL